MERLTVTQPIILLLKGTLKNALLPTQLKFLFAFLHKSNNMKEV